jgi:DNA-binding NarL/FixJ family response regulator
MAQLVGVDDSADGLDDTVGYVHRHHVHEASRRVEEQHSGLAVYRSPPNGPAKTTRVASQTKHQANDLVTTEDRAPPRGAWANRAAAAVELHGGDAARAADHALASAAAADEAGAPVEAALSRTLAGRALAQTDERDRAATELQHAARAFERCGALRYRNEAERELRKLGHGIHRRTRPGTADGIGLESLTERELQLARLVVDRKTNPEIASELFLSQKTVETHLRNIFRKVGVSSRVELARAVARAERASGAAS